MKRLVRSARRRGYTLVVVLMLSFIVIALAGVLAALTTVEWSTQTRREFAGHVDQALVSARAWSGLHARELRDAGRALLDLDQALPAAMAGTAELECVPAPGDTWLVECTVRVDDEGRVLTRRASWPLPS